MSVEGQKPGTDVTGAPREPADQVKPGDPEHGCIGRPGSSEAASAEFSVSEAPKPGSPPEAIFTGPKMQKDAFLAREALSLEARRAAQKIVEAGESSNTRRAYAGALKYWEGWYALRYGTEMALPVSAQVVVQFLTDHLEIETASRDRRKAHRYGLKGALETSLIASGLKARRGPPALNTVLQRIAVLSRAHEIKRLENPTRDPLVRQVLGSARRVYAAARKRPAAKKALTLDLLRKLLETCEEDLRGRRDRALLLLIFASGGRRRSEAISLQVEDLQRLENGDYLFVLGKSKTDQSGRLLDQKPVNGEAAEALHTWLTAARITEGPLFRRIVRGTLRGPLSGDAVWLMVRRRAALAGLKAKDFGAHSLRSGFITEAARQGVPIGEVMKLTGHRSIKTVMGYYQAGEVSALSAANLLNKRSGRS